jgi:D-amino peptidase
MNKYFISVDIEGITGVISKDFAGSSGKFYNLAQKYMVSDVNAVVKGIFKVDPDAWVVVRDAHGGKATNLDLEKLHPKAHVIQGWGGSINMVSSLDETYAGVFLVGYHAGGHNIDAVLAHTCVTSIQQIKVNNKFINESGIAGLYAGSYGVPVLFISGDDHAVAEAKQQFGNIVGVAVKQSLARDSALSVSLSSAQTLLEDGVAEAILLQQQNKIRPFVLNTPIKTSIKLYDTGYFVSAFAAIKGLLSFDNAYVFDDEELTIHFTAATQIEVARRLELLVVLLYATTK